MIIFGYYTEERWRSITASRKDRDKNGEVRKQAEKGRLKQSGLFKLKERRWKKRNYKVEYAKGCFIEDKLLSRWMGQKKMVLYCS